MQLQPFHVLVDALAVPVYAGQHIVIARFPCGELAFVEAQAEVEYQLDVGDKDSPLVHIGMPA